MKAQNQSSTSNTLGVMDAIANLQENSDLKEVQKLINRMFNAYVGTQDFEMIGPDGRMSDTFIFLRLQEFMKSLHEATEATNLQISKRRRAA